MRESDMFACLREGQAGVTPQIMQEVEQAINAIATLTVKRFCTLAASPVTC